MAALGGIPPHGPERQKRGWDKVHPGWAFAVALVVLAVGARGLRWPMPLALIVAAAAAALVAGFGIPVRHLVEGGFGYINLVLALFAGAFFGHAMRVSGAAEGVASALARQVGGRPVAILAIAAGLLFLTGMFVGLAGVAVLAVGGFVAPMLVRIGIAKERIAAFIAVLAACGMVAPPVNAPAMVIADGVNMPYAEFAGPLMALALPPALFAIGWYRRGARRATDESAAGVPSHVRCGLAAIAAVLGFWAVLRSLPLIVPDPSVPIVLVLGAIAVVPLLDRAGWANVMRETFSGMPLMLAAVLVAVGVAVQILTLTGIRGWLVVNAMSLPAPWTYLGLLSLPIMGSVLTVIGTANVLGVPFALGFISQNMILNVSALSAISAVSEFAPPTAISAALAAYVVGDVRIGRVIRESVAPMATLVALALLMLVFAPEISALIVAWGGGKP